MKAPIALFTGREAARTLRITQQRFARAVRAGKIPPDFAANAVDLFSQASIT